MKMRRNVNAPPTADLVQYFIDSAYDNVKLVADNLTALLVLASAVEAGELDNLLSSTDIDTLAELNAIVADETILSESGIDTLAKINAIVGDAQLASEAYVDAAVAGLYDHKGGYDASTNTPDLDVAPSGVMHGDAYTVTVDGDFFTDPVHAGDVLIANIDDPTVLADWTVVNRNIDESAFATAAQGALADTALQPDDGAAIKLAYEGEADTNAYTDAEKTKLAGIEALAKDDQTAPEIQSLYNSVVPQVSVPEKTAGTEVAVRRFSPLDIADMAGTHGGGGGGGSGGGGMTALYKTADYTLQADELVYSEAGLTHTLPSAPAEGTKCSVWDVSDNAGSNAITIWESGVYDPGMMTFNGTDAYYDKTGITVSGNKRTAVARFKVSSFTGGGYMRISNQAGSDGNPIMLAVFSSDYSDVNLRNKLRVICQESTGGVPCVLVSIDDVADGTEKVVFASYDGDAGSATFVINSVSADDLTNPLRTLSAVSNPLGTTASFFTVGAGNGGVNLTDGDIGYCGLSLTYLTNWSDFMDGSSPKELDETTWTEWGAQPLFWNQYGTMTDNKGSAGNMTANGTITGPSVSATVLESWSLNMNGGRFDFLYDGTQWRYSYVVQTIQPDTEIVKTKSFIATADDMWLPANGGMSALQVDEPTTYGAVIRGWQAQPTGNSRVCFSWQLPQDMDVSAGIKWHALWTQLATGSGNVMWGARVVVLSDGDTYGSINVDGSVVDTSLGIDIQHISPEINMNHSVVLNASPGDILQMYFYRLASDALDTLAPIVIFNGALIKYTTKETLTAAVTIDANAQSRVVAGTTDTLLLSDNGKEVIYENAANIAVTLPDGFPEGWNCIVSYTSTGIPTVTPATDTVNGALTGVTPLDQWEGIHLHKYKAGAYIAKGTA